MKYLLNILAAFSAVINNTFGYLPHPSASACGAVSNSVDAELNLNEILSSAIFAFKRAVLPLRMFATTFRNVVLQGTNKVAVPYYALDASATKDFVDGDGTGYVFDDTSATSMREVTINKRKYQPLHITSAELARLPMLNAQTLGELKGQKLAYDVIQDILGLVLNANYPTPAFTGAASTMDSDTVIDIRTVVGKLNWPEAGRGLLVNLDVDGSLLKDNAFKQAYSIGTDQAIRAGRLPSVLGFDYAASNAIPGNGENLIGMATFMSAILAAFSPVEPAPEVRALMSAYEVVDDADTGISIEYRAWGDPGLDTSKRVIECNYGFAKGEAAALKRIVSA